MFDSVASLSRGIGGALNNVYREPGTATSNVVEQGTNSNMSVECTKTLVLAPKIA